MTAEQEALRRMRNARLAELRWHLVTLDNSEAHLRDTRQSMAIEVYDFRVSKASVTLCMTLAEMQPAFDRKRAELTKEINELEEPK